MDSLYAETSAELMSIHGKLATLERAQSPEQAQSVENEISSYLTSISAKCQKLQDMASKEPVQKRRNAKYRAEQLAYDTQHLKNALSGLSSKLAYRFRQESEREELLSRRFTPNLAGNTALEIGDFQLQENDRLRSSHNHMDQIIDQSRAILGDLRTQHGGLKDVKRKILEVANTLGLSNTVLRLIEKRTAQDKMLLFGGMIVSLILFYIIYRGFKG